MKQYGPNVKMPSVINPNVTIGFFLTEIQLPADWENWALTNFAPGFRLFFGLIRDPNPPNSICSVINHLSEVKTRT